MLVKLLTILLPLIWCFSENRVECKSVLINSQKHNQNFMKINSNENILLKRTKRQFDLNIDAEHEEGIGTDLTAIASLNLYKSENTRIDGTAKYSQHFSDFNGYGKAKIGGSIHLTHNY